MDKKELVTSIATRLEIDEGKAELAVDKVIAELASPYVIQVPGEEVALLDNNCRNNCKEALARQRW